MRKQQNEMIYLKNKNRDGRHDVESQEGEKDNVHYDSLSSKKNPYTIYLIPFILYLCLD